MRGSDERLKKQTRKCDRKVPKAVGVRDCTEISKKTGWNQAFAGRRLSQADQA